MSSAHMGRSSVDLRPVHGFSLLITGCLELSLTEVQPTGAGVMHGKVSKGNKVLGAII